MSDLSIDRLEAWLTQKVAEQPAGSTPTTAGGAPLDLAVGDVERPTVGQSSDMVMFTLGWDDGSTRREARCVLRRQATGASIFLRPDVIREAHVLAGLAGRVPVPAIWWEEPTGDVLGAPFFVMQRVDGRVPSGKPSIHAVGWLPELAPSDIEHLWGSAMDALAAVHAVDWRATHAFLAGGDPAATTVDAHLARLAEWYRWTVGDRAFAITDAALANLFDARTTIADRDPVLVWGDARVGNMIFDDRLDVAAAIDWEVAMIGDPAIDVAHWLFFDALATEACGVEPLVGWPDRATTLAHYTERTGRALDDIEYFELMEELFIATTLIRQADAHVAVGRFPPDTRMGHDNAVTQMLARRLGLPEPEVSPDYLRHRGVKV